MDSPQSHFSSAPIPSTIRLLCISPDEPSWGSLTMQLSSRGCHEPQFRWSATPAEAVTILRREIFDALILVSTREARETCFDLQIVFDLLNSLRTGGHDEPALLVIEQIDDEHWGQLATLDCDVLRATAGWDSAALVPLILRAISRCELTRKNQQLEQVQKRQLNRGKSEAEKVLEQQRRMVHDARLLRSGETTSTQTRIPAEIAELYRQLLRTQCMMGDGSLTSELARFSSLLRTAGVIPTELLELHVRETDAMIQGIGGRSSRHLVTRADLLLIEILLYLSEANHFPQDSVPDGKYQPLI